MVGAVQCDPVDRDLVADLSPRGPLEHVRGAGDRCRVVYALLPNAIFFAPVLASEHLLAVLVLGALLVATSQWAQPPARFLVAGVLTGGATLTRGDGLVYGLVSLVFGLMFLHRSTARGVRLSLWWPVVARLGGAFTFGVVIVLAPWVIRNELVIGRGTMLGGRSGVNFFFAHNPQPGFGRYWDQRLSASAKPNSSAKRSGSALTTSCTSRPR